jgi:hypothetical protein
MVPVRARSTAVARLLGRTVVNIFHRDYQLQAAGDPTPIIDD